MSETRLWLSVRELAEHYHLSEATIRRWLSRGELNEENGAYRIGNTWRINRQEFEPKFIRRQQNQPERESLRLVK